MKGLFLGFSLLVSASSVHAAVVNSSQNINFQAGAQSLFTNAVDSGGGSLSDRLGVTFGSKFFGVTYDLSVDQGYVNIANFNGNLLYSYNDRVKVNEANNLAVSFLGDSLGIAAGFSLVMEAKYQLADFSGCFYCESFISYQSSSSPSLLGTPYSMTKIISPSGINIVPTYSSLGGIYAGLNLDLTQETVFETTGISGLLTMTNASTGTTYNTTMDILSNGEAIVDLSLDEVGLWDISLTGLTLDNDVFSRYSAMLETYVGYSIGSGCGDLSKDSDNGFFCLGDYYKKWNIDSGIGETSRFSINFDSADITTFTIETYSQGQGTSVPEASSIYFVALGLLSLCFSGRRKESKGDEGISHCLPK